MISRETLTQKYPISPLGDVVEFLDHLRKPVKESDRRKGAYPYYGANGIQGSIDEYIFDENLILLAEDGGHFENPNRGIAYAISGKSWVNNHAHVLRPKGIDLNYLLHVLKNYDVRPWITGTTRGKLTKSGAAEILIPVPLLPEQRRIAAILDKADALRGKRREAIAKLDQLLQSVFLEMFGDPASNPKNWPIQKISDMLGEIRYGSSVKAETSGEVPILRMNNLTYEGEMHLENLKYITKNDAIKNHLVEVGDILFNRTNSKELVGKTAVYVGPTPMAFAGYLVKGVVKSEHRAEYISAFMNSKYGKKLLQNMCKSIVGMANINAKEFGNIEIPIPPVELQEKFRCAVQIIRQKKKSLTQQAEHFQKLSNSLQQSFFTH